MTPKAVRAPLLDARGASAMAVVLLIAILMMLGAVAVSLLSSGIETSLEEVESSRALHIAEAGLEAAMGHLKKTPASDTCLDATTSSWCWNDGYLDKAVGGGAMDVEALEYESRDGTLVGANQCEPFESYIEAAGANPARTVYATLSWATGANMGVELYDNTIADCNNPTASATLIASSLTTGMPEVIRYRIGTAAPATLTYTARVVGTAGDVYRLRISHPDETAFKAANQCGAPDGAPPDECVRALISLGTYSSARREVFAAMNRTP
jgi:hypothetical protein